MKFVYTLFALFSLSIGAIAQELNCSVLVDDEPAANTSGRIDKEITADLQNALYDFMNSRRWTEDEFETEERINCNLVISITKMPSLGKFEANFQFQSSRTIYGTDYESPIFSFIDKSITFDYAVGQNLDYNENAYVSNLTSILAFYAYMTLAIDYDSFSELGGTSYYAKALDIVNTAQSSGLPNWTRGNNTNNRYWLADNATNPQLEDFRRGYYNYHRLAMDQLAAKPKESQELIIKVLETISKTQQVLPVSIFMVSFLSSKDAELINIFKNASPENKKKAVNLLRRIDPTNANKYQQILR
ncbi:MAG: DUF4835 family protein [Cytophagales bacterium]|nr:DUF4835 family protein [Cytophagales bacterium]